MQGLVQQPDGFVFFRPRGQIIIGKLDLPAVLRQLGDTGFCLRRFPLQCLDLCLQPPDFFSRGVVRDLRRPHKPEAAQRLFESGRIGFHAKGENQRLLRRRMQDLYIKFTRKALAHRRIQMLQIIRQRQCADPGRCLLCALEQHRHVQLLPGCKLWDQRVFPRRFGRVFSDFAAVRHNFLTDFQCLPASLRPGFKIGGRNDAPAAKPVQQAAFFGRIRPEDLQRLFGQRAAAQKALYKDGSILPEKAIAAILIGYIHDFQPLQIFQQGLALGAVRKDVHMQHRKFGHRVSPHFKRGLRRFIKTEVQVRP